MWDCYDRYVITKDNRFIELINDKDFEIIINTYLEDDKYYETERNRCWWGVKHQIGPITRHITEYGLG